MELKYIVGLAEVKLQHARNRFNAGDGVKCREWLGELYDLLDDEVGSGARGGCEEDEPIEDDIV